MHTSQQWWDATKNDPERLAEWLRKQYHGELTAAKRIMAMVEQSTDQTHTETLCRIAVQECTHARWVRDLLNIRNIDPGVHDEKARYWAQVEPVAFSFEDKAAIATLAEGMRLERIRAIACDEEAPLDIRDVFVKILIDEEWHERAFAHMTDEATIEKLRSFHQLGREVLGLEP